VNEGALIFASIIVGVAVTDLLTSFHRLLRARRQVRWDIIPLWTALTVLLTLVQVWWGLAGGEDPATTIRAFVPSLAALIILFLLAAAALPDDVGPEGVDLRAFYSEQQRTIWVLYAAALAVLIARNSAFTLMSGGTWNMVVDQGLSDVIVLLIPISLAVVRARWWHVIGLLVLSTGPLHWLSRSVG
jgi:hypothetical protein